MLPYDAAPLYGARTFRIIDAGVPPASTVTRSCSRVPSRIRPRLYHEKEVELVSPIETNSLISVLRNRCRYTDVQRPVTVGARAFSARRAPPTSYPPTVSGDEQEVRRRFVCPPAEGEFDGVDLSYLDPADPDDRRILIEAEHPEFHLALRDDYDVVIGGETVNPRLHIAMHEVVANQLWDDDPPEVWATVQRLLGLGYERHEILHMVASCIATEIWTAMREEEADTSRYVAALKDLPASWEAKRPKARPSPVHKPKPKRRRRR